MTCATPSTEGRHRGPTDPPGHRIAAPGGFPGPGRRPAVRPGAITVIVLIAGLVVLVMLENAALHLSGAQAIEADCRRRDAEARAEAAERRIHELELERRGETAEEGN